MYMTTTETQLDKRLREIPEHRTNRIKAWWNDKIKQPINDRADITASVITLMLILLGGVVFAWLLTPPITPSAEKAQAPKPSSTSAARSPRSATAQPVKVSDASGSTAALNLFISRGGETQVRESVPLATIQKGQLSPGAILTAHISDLVRSDGLTLPTDQFATWGKVDSTGTHVTIFVKVNPRYGHVSGFGSYSGIASLDDSHALGANIPVNIHVLYPNTSFALIFSLIAAFGGFTWAWLLRDIQKDKGDSGKTPTNEYFWRNFILRIAVLLAATIPVVNAQVLANPDWSGDLTQYITLATLAGAAAIALTPTLRALALPPHLPTRHGEGGEHSQSGAPAPATPPRTIADQAAEHWLNVKHQLAGTLSSLTRHKTSNKPV
jgi:hypothetical protein